METSFSHEMTIILKSNDNFFPRFIKQALETSQVSYNALHKMLVKFNLRMVSYYVHALADVQIAEKWSQNTSYVKGWSYPKLIERT